MRQKIHVYSIVAALTALTFLAVGCTMASTQDISITATDTTSQTMQTAPAASPPNSLTESNPLLLTPISKEELYHKMRNSVDYYSQISGKIIDSKTGDDRIQTVEFSCDLMQDCSYAKISFHNPTDWSDCGNQIVYAQDGKVICTDIADKTDRIQPASQQQDEKDMRTDPIRIPEVSISLFPQSLAVRYLADFEQWQIRETRACQNRTCAVVTGTIPATEQDAVSQFEIFVDQETGILMQYEGYDSSHSIIDYIYTENMQFEKDAAPVPVFSQNDISTHDKRES